MRKYLFTEGWTYTNFHDISFGNRILVWEFAQTINKLNNYEYNIVVEDSAEVRWGEMKWLNYPNTFAIRHFHDIEDKEGTLFTIKNPQDLKSFNFEESRVFLKIEPKCYEWLHKNSENIVLKEYKKTNHRPIFDIEIYDKKLENIIKSKVKNRVGLHLRGDTPNSHYNFKKNLDKTPRKEHIKDQLDRCVERGLNKFYLSTDIFTNPYQRYAGSDNHKLIYKGILGDFAKDNWSENTINKDNIFWSNAFYEFDKEEYLWIDRINDSKEILNGNGGTKQHNWVKELYEEYDIIDYRSVLEEYDTFLHNFDKLRCIDVIDLFSLIHSVEFTDGLGNGDGTFARFVKNYRKKFE
tara:strand:+ start:51 stop:1103 length:1053 start_codon:yes stop_codon:yes gene_type:complete